MGADVTRRILTNIIYKVPYDLLIDILRTTWVMVSLELSVVLIPPIYLEEIIDLWLGDHGIIAGP